MVERVSEPEPGKHWNKLPVRLATPFAQALLIDVELLPRLRGDRLGHRDRFEQAQQRDRQAAAGKGVHVRPFDLRQFERRQLGGNLADDLDALPIQSSSPKRWPPTR